jgi:hypothetical protein
VCIDPGCGGTSHVLNVNRMTSDWNTTTPYSSLSWSSPLDTFTLPAPASGQNAAPAQWMTWNVTTTVNNWYLGTQPNYGFRIVRNPQGLNTNGPATPGSTSTDPSIEPRLTVTWSGDGVVLNEPDLLHATGADLSWTKYAGGSFTAYEVHRSATPNFTPSAATRLTTIRAANATSYTDTTARPGATFSYAVVVNGVASNQRQVTLPGAGTATLTLQPDDLDGKVARIMNITTTCNSAGAQAISTIGTTSQGKRRALFEFDLRRIPSDATVNAAAFSYYYEPTTDTPGQLNVHRVTRAWREGGSNGSCNASGASWESPYGTSSWTDPGGDYASSPAATLTNANRSGGGWDTFTVTTLVNDWVKNNQIVSSSSSTTT